MFIYDNNMYMYLNIESSYITSVILNVFIQLIDYKFHSN